MRPLPPYLCSAAVLSAVLVSFSPAFAQSVKRVKDIHTAPSAAGITGTTTLRVGDVTYFSANDGVNGNERWSTDGTLGGTVLVKDIRSGFRGSDPGPYVALGDLILFPATDDTAGRPLWVSDGTSAGTVLLEALAQQPFFPTSVGGVAYFVGDDGIHGTELWKTDGTPEGTVLVKDIVPGAGGGLLTSSNPSFAEFQGFVYFAAENAAAGRELWRTDGTEAGTELFKDIRPGPIASGPFDFRKLGDTLVFRASDGTTGTELWTSDGTAAGTVRVADINPGPANSTPSQLTVIDETLYFSANDGSTGAELWKSDGTTAGTVRVKDVDPGASPSSPAFLTELGGEVYFRTSTSLGLELWKSDGTEAGTSLVLDIRPGASGSNPTNLTVFASQLFFTADDGAHGFELGKTDGTSQNTVLVKDILARAGSGSPFELTIVDDVFYFSANDGAHGRELWKSNGTAAGTVLVADLAPGLESSRNVLNSDPKILDSGKSLIFGATNAVSRVELWTLDKHGIAPLPEVAPDPASSSPEMLTGAGKVMFFLADDNTTGRELWVLSSKKKIPPGHLKHLSSKFHLPGNLHDGSDKRAKMLHMSIQNALDVEPSEEDE